MAVARGGQEWRWRRFFSCAKALALVEGFQVHTHVFGGDVYVRNSLIRLYCSCCRIGYAQKVFDERPECQDVVSWNAMMGGYVRDGQIGAVEKLFDEIPERDVLKSY